MLQPRRAPERGSCRKRVASARKKECRVRRSRPPPERRAGRFPSLSREQLPRLLPAGPHRSRSESVNSQKCFQITAQRLAIGRSAEYRLRLCQKRLVDVGEQQENREGERESAVLVRHQPASQKNSDQKVGSGNQSLIENCQAAFGHPAHELVAEMATILAALDGRLSDDCRGGAQLGIEQLFCIWRGHYFVENACQQVTGSGTETALTERSRQSFSSSASNLTWGSLSRLR